MLDSLRTQLALGWSRRPRFSALRTWEAWAYIAFVIVALGTRLWDLDGRSLHYDEVLHAWYSWRFAEGLGYAHTPLTHGPFLFHAAAGTFNAIGSSDFAARLLPALFGSVLVGLPYFLRRELGRYGAIATAFFLLISPSLLYFGRFIRNDIYMAVWAVVLLIVVFRYIERPRTPLLFVWVIIWAFAYATKESTFFLAGMFGLFLIIMTAKPLWEWVRGARPLSAITPSGDLLIVLGTLSLPFWAPIIGLLQGLAGIVLVNPDSNDPRVVAGELIRAEAETGAPAGGSLYIAAFLVLVFVGISILLGLLWNRRLWPMLVAAFVAVWLPLFTSLFTNWQGFFTGMWGSLGYWMAQQGVERANQPWYYYIVGVWTYEFLVAAPAVVGGMYLLWKRRQVFDVAIVSWAAFTFVVFTIAGERMPWLMVGITLPLAIVAGRTTGMLIEQSLGSSKRFTAYAVGVFYGALLPYVLIGIVTSADWLDDAVFRTVAAAIFISLLALILTLSGLVFRGLLRQGLDATLTLKPVRGWLLFGIRDIYHGIRRRSASELSVMAWILITLLLFVTLDKTAPWLASAVVFPFALAGGYSVRVLMRRVGRRWNRGGVAYFAVVALVGLLPFLGILSLISDENPAMVIGIVDGVVALIAVLSASVVAILASRTPLPKVGAPPASVARTASRTAPVLAAIVLGILTVAAAMTIFIAARATYWHPGFERPHELFIYSQSGQEVLYGTECLTNLAERSGVGTNHLSVFVDESDNLAWQWRWYLRDYGNVAYRALQTTPLEAPPEQDVVIMSLAAHGANVDQLADFQLVGELHILWWFDNRTYGDLTPADVLAGAVSADGWRTALNYQLSRELSTPMQTSGGFIYVRNSLTEHTQDCAWIPSNFLG